MSESFPFLRRGATPDGATIPDAPPAGAAARQRALLVLGGCAVAVAAMTAGGVLLLSGEPDDTVLDTVAVAAPAPRPSTPAPATSPRPAYAPGSGVSVPVTGGPPAGSRAVGPQVRPVAAPAAGPAATASPSASASPQPLTTPRNPFAALHSAAQGDGTSPVDPADVGAGLPLTPSGVPALPPVEVTPTLPPSEVPVEPAAVVPQPPVPAPPVPAPPVAAPPAPLPPSAPAVAPTRLLLQRVSGEPAELAGHFLLDGARVRVAVGDTFGPAGRIRLVSLVQGARVTEWTAVLQVRGAQPFDAVTGRAVLLN